jgi:flagellar hook protein FlgE
LADIKINTSQSAGSATSQVDISMNLDAGDTDTHAQATAIDPNDDTTYNYSYTTTVYDSSGESRNITTYYQHLSSYAGPSPTGSAHVWKAASFENDNGTITPNPASPNNTYFLHFDTNGQLVGTSTSSNGTGDAYLFTAGVNSSGSYVSNQLGEELTFTGAGTAQTYRSTASVTFSGAGALAGDTVTIGTDTYTFTGALATTASANWLAEQINSDPTHNYYASANNGVVTLRAKAASAFNVTENGNNVSASDNTTLTSVVNAINNGSAATGSIDLTNLAAGNTVVVAGNTFTQGVDFTNAATLVTAINTAALGVTASANTGAGVYLAANSAGSAGNALTMTATGGIAVSSATLLGGLDNSATSLVVASTYASGGSTHLRLARSDVGVAATITLPTSNTLGDGLSLDFDTATQTTVASAASSSSETAGQVSLAYAFSTGSQSITWDYTPDSASASTQSAGANETLYLNQDGYASGELESLSVDNDGLIHGSYSNGQDIILAGVGLTNFKNPGELERKGDNIWMSTDAAGTATTGLPGDTTKGLGTIEGASLEGSNVDLATEFVRMISYQRAYQANSKSISTSDEMLKEAINLKR